MKRIVALAGAIVLPLVFGMPRAEASPALIVGAIVIAGQVLPPVAAATNIIINFPKLWTVIQGLVDPRALALPPQPQPMAGK